MATSSALALAWAVTLAQFTGSDEISFDLTTSEDWAIRKSLRFRLPDEKTIQEALERVDQLIHATTEGSNDEDQPSLLAVQHQGPTPNYQHKKSKQTVVLCDLTLADVSIQGWAENEWKCNAMVCQMRHLLGLIQQADRHNRLAIITGIHPEDLDQIKRWNGHEIARHDACIHERIKEQCEFRGGTTAVCAWDGSFTYQELDEVASRYAALLQTKGVQPETFIPLYFTKSRWTAVAILSVLMAGGAFVLLDPSHPPDRLRAMCEDVGARLVLSSPRDADVARTLDLPVVEIGPEASVPDLEPRPVPIRPDNAAYICFTSGSTGKPKGAVIEHAMFSTGAAAYSFLLSSQSRVFQFAAYAFDLATFEHLATLMYGGCVCVPSEKSRRDDISGAFARLQANFVFMTPSALQMLSPADMPGLDILFVGGEASDKTLLDQWVPLTKVVNVYGPAECAVAISAHGPLSEFYNPRVLGRGMGCHHWIADTRSPGQLAPIGAVGEVVIEGPAVGRGYINATGVKAAAFLPPGSWPPISPQPHRAYRTGDLAHYIDSEGSIEFIGRKDTQVKIRGQRVELGDVEHHLRYLYPDSLNVAAEVAIPAARERAHPLLVAFIHDGDGSGSLSETSLILPHSSPFLSNWLDGVRPKMHASLPSYMVPALALPMARMPFTVTGKTDRRGLRAIVEQLSVSDLEAYSTGAVGNYKRQPDSDMGRSIQGAIAQILGLQPKYIGMEDDFIRLGGDSISAMKLAILLRGKQISLSVVDILQHPILASLTERGIYYTKDSLHSEPAPFSMFAGTLKEITPKIGVTDADILDILPATEQQRIMLSYPPQYELIHIPGPVDVARLESACKGLIHRHQILRTVFMDHCSSLFQVILREAVISFEHHECSEGFTGFQTRVLEKDSNHFLPLNMPSTRFFFLSHSDQEHMLIVRLTHAVYDGGSLPLILGDISHLYNGHTLFPPIPFSPWAYAFFASATDETYEFWRTLLQGSSMTYVGNPFVDLEEGEEIYVHATRKFSALEPPKGITLASLVKASWSLTLATHCQRTDVLFGQVVQGRSHGFPGEEAVVGPCLNLIPVRANLGEVKHGEDLLHRIQQQNAASMAYDRVQFQDVISKSTNWPKGTMFGTQLLHQDGSPPRKLQFGSASASLDEYYAPRLTKDLREFVVLSTVADGKHTLQISTTNAYLDELSAEAMIDTLNSYVQKLAKDPRAISGFHRI